MFYSNTIKKLQSRIEELEKEVNVLNEIKKQFIVSINGYKEASINFSWYFKQKEPRVFYFIKGTEPDCDYIIENIKGEKTYYKNNVPVEPYARTKIKN